MLESKKINSENIKDIIARQRKDKLIICFAEAILRSNKKLTEAIISDTPIKIESKLMLVMGTYFM